MMNTVQPITPINEQGTILYQFKGMQMSKETAVVVIKEKNKLTVKKVSDNELFSFIKHGTHWLLEGHQTSSSLLYGTRFVLS